MVAGMGSIAERTVAGNHNFVAGMGMVRTGSVPFARVFAIAETGAPFAFGFVAAAVISFVVAAAALSPDSSAERAS